MAGIYLHIPFCKQACSYCGFHFSTSLQGREEMLAAMGREITLQCDFFNVSAATQTETIETIYMGGGTPSLLETAGIARLLEGVYTHFKVAPHPEITLEANPDDMHLARLADWKSAGINRLSIGVQSFSEQDLSWMNRAHGARQALDCLQWVRQAGFENFSADLIYGFPLLSDQRWRENIRRMTGLAPPHLSAYALTVEVHTALDHAIRTRQSAPMEEETAARQFDILMEELVRAGYEHYEISNFARPGMRSRHNSHYWEGVPYLGIGPSAHSFSGNSRQWNIANNALYLKAIRQGRIPFEREMLTPVMHLNEYLMTSLRTSEGCDLGRVKAGWGEVESLRLRRDSEKFIRKGHMILLGDRLVLTNQGKLFADGIASELFREAAVTGL